MRVGLLHLRLHLSSVGSLKRKRMILNKLKDKVRNRFNVSICETGEQDAWTLSECTIAMVGLNSACIDRGLAHVLNYIERIHDLEIVEDQIEIL